MKKLLLFPTLILSHFMSNAIEVIENPFAKSFEKAYSVHPEISRGMLEAVAFCNTRFTHITHRAIESESCAGIPNAYGVMGLTLDGKNYFNNNLITVSELSLISTNEVINVPEKNILAFADAYAKVKIMLNISSNKAADQLTILNYLSELPRETTGQIYALASQEFGYVQFLMNVDYQHQYNFPDHQLDPEKIFGKDNYAILSSSSVIVTDEKVYNKSGQTFQRSALSSDYAPAIWNAAASCNFSSRSSTAVSAVTIHTVQGTYAGCISWFQNCAASVSAHYVARSSDGQITQMVLESMKAWHVGSHNPYTIGIEHEGYISSASWYTNAMYNGSASLVRDICISGYGINPLRCYYGSGCSGGASTCGIGSCTTIKGHQMFSAQTHTDPGPFWNWAKYYLLINNSPVISTITTAAGNYYDSGGSTGNYSNDERLLRLIQPAGATSITLNFTAFNTELNWDYLFIYDGATTAAPLIGQYTGTSSPGSVTSSSGSLLLEFRSDCATVSSGWAANWTSTSGFATTADSIAPTTSVSTSGVWETSNFVANFTDADNAGGSGLERSYYQVIDFNGTEWRANNNNGFFADNFDDAIHPDWTTAVGTFSINAGSLYQSDEANGNTNIYAALNQSLSDRSLFNFYGKIDGAGISRRAGFHFFSDNGSLPNRGNSYFVWFRVDDGFLQIYKVVGDVFGSPVVNVPFITIAGQWYDYKVIHDHITGKITIYRDNQFVTSWTDPSPLATIGNSISFRTGNANFAINELKVYRSRNPSSANITAGAASTNDIRFQNPNPTTFSAKVKSICADTAGNLSAIFYQNINVDWTAPSAVDTLNDGTGADIAITTSATDLSANWSISDDPHSAIARYWYAVGTSPGATDVMNWTDNWYSDSVTVSGLSLVNLQTYYFSVKAEDGAGLISEVVSSNGQMVQLIATGTEDQSANSEITISPNPFSNNSIITYSLSTNSNVEITLNDVLGKEIHLFNAGQTAGKHELTINANEMKLSKGLYFIKIRAENSQKIIKFIIK